MTLLQHYVCDLTPLFLGRIYSGRIMSTGVKEEDGAVRSGGKGAEELITSEADGLGIVVLVGGRIDPDVLEDSEVVCYKNRGERIRHVRRFMEHNITYPRSGH